jgi:hypothetical protein
MANGQITIQTEDFESRPTPQRCSANSRLQCDGRGLGGIPENILVEGAIVDVELMSSSTIFSVVISWILF